MGLIKCVWKFCTDPLISILVLILILISDLDLDSDPDPDPDPDTDPDSIHFFISMLGQIYILS
jgi:hypothetical protein